MKERPILFSGPMVRAILEDRKTQTRRVIKPQPHGILCRDCAAPSGYTFDSPAHGEQLLTCPYGVPGDRLWVRETWMPDGADVRFEMMKRGEIPWAVRYAASEPELGKMFKWHPSIHMPRVASRISLEVVKVRVERLQDISEDDAGAEGFQVSTCATMDMAAFGTGHARHRFHELWDSINAERGFGWAKNPWVWVVEFKVVTTKSS